MNGRLIKIEASNGTETRSTEAYSVPVTQDERMLFGFVRVMHTDGNRWKIINERTEYI